MHTVPILLVREGPTMTILIGFSEAECHQAADTLASWWGAPAGSRRTPGGQILETGLAEGLVAPYQVAMVAVDEHEQVLAIALVDDRASAAFLAQGWAGDSDVRILPAGTVGEALAVGERRDPRVLSTVFCSHCGDHPLHLDPVFDDRSWIDGARICNACGTIEALRLDRGLPRPSSQTP